MEMRRDDDFIFVFCRGSQRAKWWIEYRRRFTRTVSWSEFVLPLPIKAYRALGLLGLRFLPEVRLDADVYLHLAPGTMGRRSKPLINLVADLSAIQLPKTSSLKWHGRRLNRQALQDGARIAAQTICISEHTARDLISRIPELSTRVTVVPNGIANEWFQEALATPSGGAPDDIARPYFIWYGAITPRKNVAGLLRGYASAVRSESGVSRLPHLLLVAGQSEHDGVISALISSLGISDRVHRLAYQTLTELIGLVSRSSGLVFPSHFEGFGMPILEAYAQGIPVLTSDRSAMPEVAGGLAVMCNPDDTNSIAEGIVALTDRKQHSEEMIRARRAWAEKFTAKASAEGYNAVIEKVLTAR